MITGILIIVVVAMLFGLLPTWNYSRGWGYYPSGGAAFLLLVFFILLMLGII